MEDDYDTKAGDDYRNEAIGAAIDKKDFLS